MYGYYMISYFIPKDVGLCAALLGRLLTLVLVSFVLLQQVNFSKESERVFRQNRPPFAREVETLSVNRCSGPHFK